jgi:hypothetical protein
MLRYFRKTLQEIIYNIFLFLIYAKNLFFVNRPASSRRTDLTSRVVVAGKLVLNTAEPVQVIQVEFRGFDRILD